MSTPIKKEQRVAEATSLRALFQEQWTELRRRVAYYDRRSQRKRDRIEGLNNAVEQIVAGTDARLRAVGGYQKRLRESTGALLGHLDATLRSLSTVIEIDQSAFASDPLVKSLFSSHKQMLALISQSPKIYDYLATVDSHGLEYLYLLLTLTRKEKTTFGSQLHGNLVMRDAQQTNVQFHSHRVLAAESSEKLIRSALKRQVFEAVIQHVRGHLLELHHGRVDGSVPKSSAVPVGELQDPRLYLKELKRLLELPKALIWSQRNTLHLDSMGTLLPADTASSSRRLSLDELVIGDEPSQIVCIARLRRSEIPDPSRLEFPAAL